MAAERINAALNTVVLVIWLSPISTYRASASAREADVGWGFRRTIKFHFTPFNLMLFFAAGNWTGAAASSSAPRQYRTWRDHLTRNGAMPASARILTDWGHGQSTCAARTTD